MTCSKAVTSCIPECDRWAACHTEVLFEGDYFKTQYNWFASVLGAYGVEAIDFNLSQLPIDSDDFGLGFCFSCFKFG